LLTVHGSLLLSVLPFSVKHAWQQLCPLGTMIQGLEESFLCHNLPLPLLCAVILFSLRPSAETITQRLIQIQKGAVQGQGQGPCF
jgi:hypothetical protein